VDVVGVDPPEIVVAVVEAVEIVVVAGEEVAEIVVVVEGEVVGIVAEELGPEELGPVELGPVETVVVAVEGVDPETVVVAVAAEIAAAVADLLVVVEEEEAVDIDPDSPRGLYAVAHLPTQAHRTKSHLKTA